MMKKESNCRKKRIYLSPSLVHKEELNFILEAFNSNWISTVGENINIVEEKTAKICEKKYCIAVSNGTAGIHLAIRLAAKKKYKSNENESALLTNKKVFCSDLTFCATCNPILYENGTPIFIDSEYSSWNMDPKALEAAFKLYPDVKIVIYSELYGFPGNIDKIRRICHKNNAILIEDAAEGLGASYLNHNCGYYGDISIVSFNGNKIITGGAGGCVLTNDKNDAVKIKKWSTQAKENCLWYEHKELGFNYRISNIVAGIIRGQLLHLKEHINLKRDIYYKYKEGLANLNVEMNPVLNKSKPNFWLSALLINKKNKISPSLILDELNKSNIEGRHIWKPMHMQPLYAKNLLIGKNGLISGDNSVSEDIFNRGLCLPSNLHMKDNDIATIIKIIRGCFE